MAVAVVKKGLQIAHLAVRNRRRERAAVLAEQLPLLVGVAKDVVEAAAPDHLLTLEAADRL